MSCQLLQHHVRLSPATLETGSNLMQSTLQSWLNLLCQMLPHVTTALAWQSIDEDSNLDDPNQEQSLQEEPSQESPGHKERVLVTWPVNTVFPDELSSAAKMAEEQQAPVVVSREDGLVMARPLTLDGAAFGEKSLLDFRLFTNSLAALKKDSIVLNVGSAVIMPEVFLKALTIVRNLDR